MPSTSWGWCTSGRCGARNGTNRKRGTRSANSGCSNSDSPTVRCWPRSESGRERPKDRLSESNYVVGEFYYRNKWYPGAIDRFENILNDDPGYTERDAVYFRLAHSYKESAQPEKALPMFERLLSEFPNTEYLEDVTQYMAEFEVIAAQTEAEATTEAEASAEADGQAHAEDR